jgi:cytidylate kinase
MENFVLSIARQFGSRGRQIAQETAGLLGVEFYDRDIVEEAAKRINLPVHDVSDEEENVHTTILHKLFPLGRGTTDVQDEIFAAQESIVRDMADKGSCIIVGRCSDYILRDHPNLLRVYVYAPLEFRIRYCVEELFMNERDARRMCVDVDRARDQYHLRYAGYRQDDPAYKDLMINSAAFGVHETAEYLADLVKHRFGD